ncbi:hypothetical protein V1478_006715 [Vespula squamosa]
MFALGN